jgi:hypothetical protein
MSDDVLNQRSEESQGRPFGTLSGLAIGGGLSLILVAVFAPIGWCGNKQGSRKAASISHLKQISLAHSSYLADWDGFGPSAESWADRLRSYDLEAPYFWSPHDERKLTSLDEFNEGYGYAYFQPLEEVKEWAVQNPEEVPLVFDSSDMRWNANGDLSLLPDPPRWDGKNLIAFLDGHVKAVEGTPEVEIKLP